MKVRSLAAVLVLLGVVGCRGARIHPAELRVPEYDPCVQPPVAARPIPPPRPSRRRWSGTSGSRRRSTATRSARHTPSVATVLDSCGNPLPGQRVESILARHAGAVGGIVASDDQYGVGAITPLPGGSYASTRTRGTSSATSTRSRSRTSRTS